MAKKKFDSKLLDTILNNMIDTVGNSKDEIFQIGEQCRKDFESISDELKEVKIAVIKAIDDGDQLEEQARQARNRLSDVSRNFGRYSEEEVREAYEKAHKLQMDLSLSRQQEKLLRNRRDDLERRLIGIQETIDRADLLISQVSVVMSYLTSDLKEMGQALEDAQIKQDFGLKIIEAQEEERKRLSREIHDGPAQMLANVMMRSDLIERVYRERGAEQAWDEIKSFKKMVRNALYEVRRIIYDLRPMALDDLGLIPTLKKYLQTTEEYHKSSKISFISVGQDRRLATKYEVSIFRLIQESVQNALKHGEAREIQVKVELGHDRITVMVKDDGKGFNLDQVKFESFGILGMNERVDLLNGEISINSKVGAGTIVLIQIPLVES
ncbi:sensor histidine kinase [Bacillus sp. CGMCC 1.16607]|uniref:sensor histidine kinase n=1 Tax=Bacillus sp. CGMCC 1.16607 TaxID=3351842 RepID=UPI00362AFF54